MHIFSMTCKAESALDRLGDPDERQKAIQWFRDHSIAKLYIESYRHGRMVPQQRLREIRDDFISAGFEVGGCITPTNLNKDGADALVSCFTDAAALRKLQDIVEQTARVFDFFIIDDFLFTCCTCDSCKELRANRSWAETRCEIMLRVSKEHIIGPAKAVNPDVCVILKYPLWYEYYLERGYDVIRETEIYDQVWIGTETRDPDSPQAGKCPQTAGCWIQGWMNNIAGSKSGGGWYDPIDTSPFTYLEQARQTIIGKAKESLLHCYDYLGTDTPGVAIHGRDLEVRHGRADAEAFRQEVTGLKKLADIIEPMEPYGVCVPKNPAQAPLGHGEKYLPGFIGMLGIAMLPAASLEACQPALLGMQAYGFDGLVEFIFAACDSGTPLTLTKSLYESLLRDGANLPDSLNVLDCPDDLWQLTELPPEILNDLRNRLLAPFGIEFFSPGKVSLHLFRGTAKYCEIIENFNDFSVDVCIKFSGDNSARRIAVMILPEMNNTELNYNKSGGYDISLPPRSLVVLATC